MPYNEWVDMEREAIAKMKKGVPLDRIKWDYPGLDRFWLRMMWEKHSPKQQLPIVVPAQMGGIGKPRRPITGRRK